MIQVPASVADPNPKDPHGMFLGLLDPDPNPKDPHGMFLGVLDPDPDHAIIKQK
jgi:hypothetical protein